MNFFSIGDYSILGVAANEVGKAVSKITSSRYNIDLYIKKICDENVFAGPLSDELSNGFETINSNIALLSIRLNSGIPVFNSISNNYIVSDSKISNSLTNL